MLSLSFVGDSKMAELNAHYRGKDRPTDVLSFPAILPSDYPELASDHGGYPLGDIVISLDTAAQQSRRYGWTLGEELARLLVHGLLHLLGYDHEKVPPRQAALMRRVEKTLFAKVRGLAPGLVRRRKSVDIGRK
jgi:rRNA maturation RNase YbeY